ncbi:MAG: metallophosphoesterase family protein [Alphaproteobacteria bacterium]|nr:metallophosphoesterase family protein [Alphaproteobacteria bacterium]
MAPQFTWFKRLLARGGKPNRRMPAIPAGHRVYAIGDIHGRADLLAQLHRQIQGDAANAPEGFKKTIIHLGDYVDRGLDSMGVIDLLLTAPLDDFESICLKGNHEDTLIRFLEDPSLGPGWFAIGGDATVLSYGIRIPAGLTSTQYFEYAWKEFRTLVPQDHWEFLASLQLMHQIGDYVFVHAGIKPGVPLEQQDPEDLMWIRGEFLGSKLAHEKVVVHGHMLKSQPDIQANRIGIDTGAFATNVLTCIVLEGVTQRFLSTAPRPV